MELKGAFLEAPPADTVIPAACQYDQPLFHVAEARNITP
jgi:hypothetical protein